MSEGRAKKPRGEASSQGEQSAVTTLERLRERVAILLDDKTLSAADLHEALKTSITEDLFERFLICVNGSSKGAKSTHYRVQEVELYLSVKGKFEDTYTHSDVQQALLGTWYFHKKGGSYKGGSFKGLDITVGAGPNLVFGMLLRSAIPVDLATGDATGSIIEGPCLLVDQLLRDAGAKDIKALVGEDGFLTIDASLTNQSGVNAAKDVLRLVPAVKDSSEVAPANWVAAPRVGLVVRNAEQMQFGARFFRFVRTSPTCSAKQRAGIVAAVIAKHPDKSIEAVAKLTGGTKKTVTEIHETLRSIAAGTITREQLLSDASSPHGIFGGDVMKSGIIARIVGLGVAMQTA